MERCICLAVILNFTIYCVGLTYCAHTNRLSPILLSFFEAHWRFFSLFYSCDMCLDHESTDKIVIFLLILVTAAVKTTCREAPIVAVKPVSFSEAGRQDTKCTRLFSAARRFHKFMACYSETMCAVKSTYIIQPSEQQNNNQKTNTKPSLCNI